MIKQRFLFFILVSFVAPVFSQQFKKITPEAQASGKQDLELLEAERNKKLYCGLFTSVAVLGLGAYLLLPNGSRTDLPVVASENEQLAPKPDIASLVIALNKKISENQGFSFKRIFNGFLSTLAHGAFGLGSAALVSRVNNSFSSPIKGYFSNHVAKLYCKFDILMRYISDYDDTAYGSDTENKESLSERKKYIIYSSNTVIDTVASLIGAIYWELEKNKNNDQLVLSVIEGLIKESNLLVDHLENGTTMEFKQVKIAPAALYFRKKIETHLKAIEAILFNYSLAGVSVAGVP